MTKNTYGINNKSNGVVRMYVTISVTINRKCVLIRQPSCKLYTFRDSPFQVRLKRDGQPTTLVKLDVTLYHPGEGGRENKRGRV